MTEEQKQVYTKMVQDARKYAHNIMDVPGEYDPEGFENIIKEKQKNVEGLFKRFSDEEMLMNKEHLIQGYCTFGTEYLKNVYEKDKDSLLNMFENIIQEYLDMQLMIDKARQSLEQQVAMKKTAQDSYTNEKEEK